MRGMRAENEGGLEQDLIDDAGAPAVVAEAVALVPLGMLVAQAEAEEFRGHEGDIGLHRPLPPALIRELGPVVAESEQPAPPRLPVHPGVPPALVADTLLGRFL